MVSKGCPDRTVHTPPKPPLKKDLAGLAFFSLLLDSDILGEVLILDVLCLEKRNI